MPEVKSQEEKAKSTIALQPEKMSSKIQLIIAMDLAGFKGNSIAEAVGLTPARVSIIRNSPLFLQEREARWKTLQSQVMDKKTTEIAAGDPVEARIKDLALQAVNKYDMLLSGAKSEFVQKATADSILDRAGYKAKTDKTIVSVEVTEKMADRFERVLGYNGSNSVTKKVTTTTES